MISRFISYWILFLMIPLYLILKTVCLHTYFNIYYPILLLGYGYLGYLLYHMIQGVTFDLSYIILGLVIHLGPLYLMKRYQYQENTYSISVFLGLLVLYLGYLETRGTDVIQVYLFDPQITSIQEITQGLK